MVTASIVVHKTPSLQFAKALDCLLKSEKVEKIIIIDNSPTQDLKTVALCDNKVKYHHVNNNGFGAGHNIAIRKSIESETTYHLVMNADVWWEGDIINAIIEYLEENKDVGLLAPKVFYPDGDLQYSCRMLPTPFDLFIKRFLPAKLIKRRMDKYLLVNHDHDYSLNCPYLLGSFLFFRVEALKREGIFDERFFMYPEDIDITRRIHEKWKTIYYPKVSIIHEHQAASRKNLKMLKIHTFNMVKYFNKWGWWRDSKRTIFNRELIDSIKELPAWKIQIGRG